MLSIRRTWMIFTLIIALIPFWSLCIAEEMDKETREGIDSQKTRENYLHYNALYFENQATKENYLMNTPTFVGFSAFAFATGYISSITLDRFTGGGLEFGENFVPVVGPIIAYFRYDNVINKEERTGNQRVIEKTMFMANGIIQLISLIHFSVSLYDFYHPDPRVIPPKAKKEDSFSIEPHGSQSGNDLGFNLIYHF